jgi:hypothetical protein
MPPDASQAVRAWPSTLLFRLEAVVLPLIQKLYAGRLRLYGQLQTCPSPTGAFHCTMTAAPRRVAEA